MRKTGIALSVLLEASLAPCVAGAVTNAYYRADRAAASTGGTTFCRLVPLMPRMRPEKTGRFPTP